MSLHVPASGICRKQRHPIESPRLRIVCPKILGVTNILYTVASFQNRGWGEKNGKERKEICTPLPMALGLSEEKQWPFHLCSLVVVPDLRVSLPASSQPVCNLAVAHAFGHE